MLNEWWSLGQGFWGGVVVMTWRCLFPLKVCVISQGKIPWTSPPWQGIEPGAWRRQTVRYIAPCALSDHHFFTKWWQETNREKVDLDLEYGRNFMRLNDLGPEDRRVQSRNEEAHIQWWRKNGCMAMMMLTLSRAWEGSEEEEWHPTSVTLLPVGVGSLTSHFLTRPLWAMGATSL